MDPSNDHLRQLEFVVVRGREKDVYKRQRYSAFVVVHCVSGIGLAVNGCADYFAGVGIADVDRSD